MFFLRANYSIVKMNTTYVNHFLLCSEATTERVVTSLLSLFWYHYACNLIYRCLISKEDVLRGKKNIWKINTYVHIFTILCGLICMRVRKMQNKKLLPFESPNLWLLWINLELQHVIVCLSLTTNLLNGQVYFIKWLSSRFGMSLFVYIPDNTS